jgi:hypothetical protein
MAAYCQPFMTIASKSGLEQPKILSENSFEKLLHSYFGKMPEEDVDRLFHFYALPHPTSNNGIGMDFGHMRNWVRPYSYCPVPLCK